MSDETLLSAARRLVRFVRINNERDGGLISNETSWATDVLDQMIKLEDKKAREAQEKKDD